MAGDLPRSFGPRQPWAPRPPIISRLLRRSILSIAEARICHGVQARRSRVDAGRRLVGNGLRSTQPAASRNRDCRTQARNPAGLSASLTTPGSASSATTATPCRSTQHSERAPGIAPLNVSRRPRLAPVIRNAAAFQKTPGGKHLCPKRQMAVLARGLFL